MKRPRESEESSDENLRNDEDNSDRQSRKRQRRISRDREEETSRMKCRNCKKPSIPPIMRCQRKKPHIFCYVCTTRRQLTACSRCETRLNPSRKLSKKAKKISLKGPHIHCPFSKSGCTFENHSMKKIIRHKLTCDFRDALCHHKNGRKPCNGLPVPIKILATHLNQAHGKMIMEVNVGELHGLTIETPREYECQRVENTKLRMKLKPCLNSSLVSVNNRFILINTERTTSTLAKVWASEVDGNRISDLLVKVAVGIDRDHTLVHQREEEIGIFAFHDSLEFAEQKASFNLPHGRDDRIYLTFKFTDIN